MDELKPVAEFEGVFVDKQGRVFYEREGVYEELPRTRDDNGNCLVSLRFGGKTKKRFVNKLVMEAFGEVIGLDPRQYHVMHIDGNRFNCALKNLTLMRAKWKD